MRTPQNHQIWLFFLVMPANDNGGCGTIQSEPANDASPPVDSPPEELFPRAPVGWSEAEARAYGMRPRHGHS